MRFFKTLHNYTYFMKRVLYSRAIQDPMKGTLYLMREGGSCSMLHSTDDAIMGNLLNPNITEPAKGIHGEYVKNNDVYYMMFEQPVYYK